MLISGVIENLVATSSSDQRTANAPALENYMYLSARSKCCGIINVVNVEISVLEINVYSLP